MFALLLLLYRNKEQWAFKYPGQVTPAAREDPVKRLSNSGNCCELEDPLSNCKIV